MSKVRIPKDVHKYISSKIAAARLMYIALEQVLCLREGVRVKWELKLHYYCPEDVLAKVKSPAVAMGASYSSGPHDEAVPVTEEVTA